MSLKGTRTHPPAPPNASVGSHLPPFGPIPNPSALASNAASAKHGPPSSDGFNPDGRKKFNIAAGANCPVGIHVNASGQIDNPNGLEGYRVLVDEQRIWEESIEALFTRQVSQSGSQGAGHATWQGLYALKDVGCIQIEWTGIARVLVTRCASCKKQLATLRSVRRITQKIQPEQRVIIEHAVRGTYHALAVSSGIPSDTNPRLEVIGVGLNSLLQPERVIGGKG